MMNNTTTSANNPSSISSISSSGNSNPSNSIATPNQQQQSPSIIGISHQPYRSYLTDRNHFYHSASVANPAAQLLSSSSTASATSPTTPTTPGLHFISHSQTVNTQPQSPQPAPQQQQQSATKSAGQLATSRTSLNSQSSHTNRQSSASASSRLHHSNLNYEKPNRHHHQHQQQKSIYSSSSSPNRRGKEGKMMKQTERSSTGSSTFAISGGGGGGGGGNNADGYGGKMPESDEEDEETSGSGIGSGAYRPVSACTRCMFGLLWCVAQIGLWGAVALLAYWMLKFDRGFAFQNDKRKMFNLHAFLMLTGFIFVNGQSMLIYKTYMCCKKIYNKITHAIFFVLSISLVSFGMLIGIQAQQLVPLTADSANVVHFYSLHSWIGLITCGLFALQFFFGFITFLVLLCCERGTAGYRARFLPVHVTFGLVIFLLAVATCLSGLLQTARSRLSGPTAANIDTPDYKDVFVIRDNNPFTNASLVLNACGGCLILLAILMPYLVRNFSFNRRADRAASFRVNH